MIFHRERTRKLTKEERKFRENLIKENFWVKVGNYIYLQDKSNKKKGNYNYPKYKRSRISAELFFDRKLKSNEIVHHINGNTFDDSSENLKIMDEREHNSHHHAGDRFKRNKKTKKKYKRMCKDTSNSTKLKGEVLNFQWN